MTKKGICILFLNSIPREGSVCFTVLGPDCWVSLQLGYLLPTIIYFFSKLVSVTSHINDHLNQVNGHA